MRKNRKLFSKAAVQRAKVQAGIMFLIRNFTYRVLPGASKFFMEISGNTVSWRCFRLIWKRKIPRLYLCLSILSKPADILKAVFIFQDTSNYLTLCKS